MAANLRPSRFKGWSCEVMSIATGIGRSPSARITRREVFLLRDDHLGCAAELHGSSGFGPEGNVESHVVGDGDGDNTAGAFIWSEGRRGRQVPFIDAGVAEVFDV